MIHVTLFIYPAEDGKRMKLLSFSTSDAGLYFRGYLVDRLI